MRECLVRDAAATRLPPSARRHSVLCWYIYRLIIELVSITITNYEAARQVASAEGWRSAAYGATASALHRCVTLRTARPPHAQPSDFISANPLSWTMSTWQRPWWGGRRAIYRLRFDATAVNLAGSNCFTQITTKVKITYVKAVVIWRYPLGIVVFTLPQARNENKK